MIISFFTSFNIISNFKRVESHPIIPSTSSQSFKVGVAKPYDPNSTSNDSNHKHQMFLNVNPPNVNIDYHQGDIITGLVNVHFIYYGDWSRQDERDILENFFKNIDGTPWFQTLTAYNNQKGGNITGPVHLTHVLVNEYTHGKYLTKQDHMDIVNEAINVKLLPEQENAIYYILSSKDIKSEGLCKDYCGYHSHFQRPNNSLLKFAYVGNAETQCPTGCAHGNPESSQNENVGIDGMINIMAHEFIEVMNDPFLNAWFDVKGQESADKCNFNFGKTVKAENGGEFNMIVGGIKYNIQMNWNPNSAICEIGS
ncbi:hypothetical protein G9A89_011212 [Geosiphon pyriformis]|nr:hypothetical protein G9A89_011212 [Geosiphon pyriformis]